MVDLLGLTAQIVSAHVRAHEVEAEQLPELIRGVFRALNAPAPDEPPREPIVPVNESVFRDHLICLECGHRLRTLKRHLMVRHEMSVEQYRAQFQLPIDYPTAAPDHSAIRSTIAKRVGLGRGTGGRGRRTSGNIATAMRRTGD